MEKGKSPLTGVECNNQIDPVTFTRRCWDPICGPFEIDQHSAVWNDDSVCRKLACVLAQQTLREGRIPTHVTADESGIKDQWSLVPLEHLLARYPRSVSGILDEALVNLSRLIAHPSEKIRVGEREIWLTYGHDHDSSEYVLSQLCELGYIKAAGSDPDPLIATQSYTIESKGWSRLFELQSSPVGGVKQGFVAMWFSKEMESVFNEAIRPAIEECDWKCVRIDSKEHNNKICDEIVAEIRKSRFVVADFSGNRGGVYFEAGFAYGLGIPVIWTVKRADLEAVHFDTRQYNHIVYESNDELFQRLKSRIEATVGKSETPRQVRRA
jgi:nucleoside 2-deoxyribosyltransferase